MIFYFCTHKNFGDNILLNPRIPKTYGENEDNQTKRICVSSSVEGCIKAIGCNIFIGCNLYIHKADIDISIIKQPTESEVPDVWVTGECWVLKPTMFELFKTLLVKDIKKFMIAPRESLFNVEYQLI